jgi:class 3 adenylate cyclase
MTAARRLAAILAADVVGYPRLTGEDEVGTAQAVRERREGSPSDNVQRELRLSPNRDLHRHDLQ